MIKNMENAERDRNTFMLVFTFYSNNIGKFSIIQKAEFKNYEIISLDFVKASDVIYNLPSNSLETTSPTATTR